MTTRRSSTPWKKTKRTAIPALPARAGNEVAKDDLIYEEKDERFSVGVEKSRRRQSIWFWNCSHTTSEARFLDAANPTGEWRLIAPRQQDVEYYATTSATSSTFAPMTKAAPSDWYRAITARRKRKLERNCSRTSDVMLEHFEAFQDFYVLSERENGLRSSPWSFGQRRERSASRIPEPVTLRPADNRESRPNSSAIPTSRWHAASVFDYNVETHASHC